MQSVGGSYDARLSRVISARGLLEGQIQQQLVLLEGYSRIASMIEIEVEMNTSVRPRTTPPNCLRPAVNIFCMVHSQQCKLLVAESYR